MYSIVLLIYSALHCFDTVVRLQADASFIVYVLPHVAMLCAQHVLLLPLMLHIMQL